jgi:hypothetical protein
MEWVSSFSAGLGTRDLPVTVVPCGIVVSANILISMRQMLRFLWNSTRGHRIAPWRSPYLLWRIETYTGVKMTQIGFLEFWEFLWTERQSLWRFLKWTGEMDHYIHPKAKQL